MRTLSSPKISKGLGVLVLAFAISLFGGAFSSMVQAPAEAQADEEVHFGSKMGAVFEYLTMHPFYIVTKNMVKHPWDPVKTRFLSRDGTEISPGVFSNRYRKQSVALYLDADGLVVMLHPADM